MIDENKLKEQMFALVEQIGDERLHIDAVVQLIDDAPTVDAVPVEWILEEAKKRDKAVGSILMLTVQEWKDEQTD